MGSPQQPTAAQRAELEKARKLQAMPGPDFAEPHIGLVTIPITLPRQGVSLIRVTW